MIATGWMVLPYFFRFDQHTKRGNSSIFSYRWLRCDTFVDSVYLPVTMENNDCDGVQTLDVGANIREWPTATFVQCWICTIQMIPRLRFSTDMNKHRIKKLMLYNQDQSYFKALLVQIQCITVSMQNLSQYRLNVALMLWSHHKILKCICWSS